MMKRELLGKSIWDLFDKGVTSEASRLLQSTSRGLDPKFSPLILYRYSARIANGNLLKVTQSIPLVCPGEISFERLKLSFLKTICVKAVKNSNDA